MIKIYLLDTLTSDMKALSQSIYVSEKDLSDLSKYKVKEAHDEKVGSTYLKKRFIGEYHLGERGKPLSDKTHFNISHSHGLVVLGISPSSPIGIDIEKIRPVKEELKRYVSNDEEFALGKDDEGFFEIWTNKESLLKAIGTGIDRRLPDVPGLPLNGVREYEGKRFISKTIRHQDYVLSVTIEGNEPFEIDAMTIDDYQ